MCIPTNFGSRKKHTSTFQKTTKKDNPKEDNFFCDADDFLNENESKKEKKDENPSFKS